MDRHDWESGEVLKVEVYIEEFNSEEEETVEVMGSS
jgi:hypothetical protein